MINNPGYLFDELSFLHDQSNLSADLKSCNNDFIVDEVMSITMSGEGEHSWLHITKNGSNTDFVANELAKFAEVKSSAVSYAGLKDKNAITTQWFSVHLPGITEPDWELCQSNDFVINSVHRHSRKLKRGALSANRFKIRLQQLQGSEADWQNQLILIAKTGVPNYFGKQRFGHQMNNLNRASELIDKNKLRRLKPHKRGIYLSAMRSWIFNQIVSRRLQDRCFFSPIEGDVFMLSASHACFYEELSENITARLENNEINLTAALWGKGESMAKSLVEELERAIAMQFSSFAETIEKVGMKQERRAMRLIPVDMQWQFEADKSLLLSFELPKGSYATSVLRELCNVHDKSLPAFK